MGVQSAPPPPLPHLCRPHGHRDAGGGPRRNNSGGGAPRPDEPWRKGTSSDAPETPPPHPPAASWRRGLDRGTLAKAWLHLSLVSHPSQHEQGLYWTSLPWARSSAGLGRHKY